MQVLVTGAAGYLGAVLCDHLLSRGYHVLALDNCMYGQLSLLHFCNHPRFSFARGDVRDETTMRRMIKDADVIIPLAALVGAPACELDPVGARMINLDAIRQINAMRSKSQLVIFPTTNSGYGTQSGEVYCTEETALEPISIYGRTKVEAEKELLNSPNVITLRLATVFGTSPRMRIDLLVNHFVYCAYNDHYIVIFEKDFKRNYIHIRDVADCFVYCIEHADTMIGEAYNAGLDDANLSKEELALAIKRHLPNFYIHFAEVGSDPDKRNYIVSNNKLKNAGFEARRSIDEGIRELIFAYSMLGRNQLKNV
ncbi:MAG: NAD(P)-dependent oxidoreductase [Desulfosarcinaceae bacterium]